MQGDAVRFSVNLSDAVFADLAVRAGEEERPVATMAALLIRDGLAGRVVSAWARHLEDAALEEREPGVAPAPASIPVASSRSSSAVRHGLCLMSPPKGTKCKSCGKVH